MADTVPADDDEREALRQFPNPWDIQRRVGFVAGLRWYRAQVHGGAPPSDVLLRRQLAVREASQWHDSRSHV